MDGAKTPIVMVGGMGVGKTTVGRLVAAGLGRSLVDSDQEIAALTGKTARQVAEAQGVAALHQLEWRVLDTALQRHDGVVIAAAASVVDQPGIAQALDDALVVWIDRPVIGDGSGGAHRRVVSGDEEIDRRQGRYAQLADLILSGPGTPRDYSARVLEHLGGDSRFGGAEPGTG